MCIRRREWPLCSAARWRGAKGVGRQLIRASLFRWVLGVGFATVALYFALPGDLLKDALYLIIGAIATVLIVVGVRMHRPAAARGWYLVAAANGCFVAADSVFNAYDILLQGAIPLPSIADAIYLAGYPLLFAGILRIFSRRNSTGGRDNWVDAGIVCVGTLGLTWHFLMGPTLHSAAAAGESDGALGSTAFNLGKFVTMVYPAMDLGILAVVVAAALRGTGRRAADRLLLAAVVLMLVADFWYDLSVLHDTYSASSPVNLFFLLNYVMVAAAATHPSSGLGHGELGESALQITQSRRWVPFLGSAALISPALLLVNGIAGVPVDVPVLAASSLIVFALIALRAFWLFARIKRQNELLQHRSQSLRWALAAQELLEEDLQHQALHDALTGLANRALLQDRIEQALKSASPQSQVSLCFCDLDDFKAVNDTLGHPAGDELLTVVAKRLTSIVRGAATVARLGGDEFAVLLEDAEQPGAAAVLAERIVSVLRQPIRLADQNIALSVSVGVVVAGPGTTVDRLMSEADAAMYGAKTSGKNRVAVFETFMRSRLIEKMAVVNGFSGALRRSEFLLEFQPHFGLEDNRLSGFECLVRWQHPTLGLIGPGRFIAIAEETRFILELGSWILLSACRHAAAWPTTNISSDSSKNGRPAAALTVSVNLSGWQLQDPDLLQIVREALEISDLPPERLILEVTESVLLADPAHTASVLRALRGLGIRIAIDDFGTGYSSLSQLRQLPVDILKIDKSFIDPLIDPANEGDAFVTTIVRLANELKLGTVAEGIEHEIQRDTLIRLGCREGQGYLMSASLSAKKTSQFIVEHEARFADRVAG